LAHEEENSQEQIVRKPGTLKERLNTWHLILMTLHSQARATQKILRLMPRL
jgi:hypothetical protein